MIYISGLLILLQTVGFMLLFVALSFSKTDIVHSLGVFILALLLMSAKGIINDIFILYQSWVYRRPRQNNDEPNLHV